MKTTPSIYRSAGFTLIEIMVVVVILAILAATVVPKIMDRPQEARIAKAKQDVRALEAALDLYKLDNFDYPDTEQGLESLVSKPSGGNEAKRYRDGGYVKSLQEDPWGNPYQYIMPGEHSGESTPDIYSLGPDQSPSEDDIGNWNLNK